MIEEKEKNQEGIFINGRAQILEMVKFLTTEEKSRLISQIQRVNPALAKDMMQEGLTIETITKLDRPSLQALFHHISPSVLGIAIKGLDEKGQRRILSMASEDFAVDCYKTLKQRLQGNVDLIPKAQRKVLHTLTELHKRGLVSLS